MKQRKLTHDGEEKEDKYGKSSKIMLKMVEIHMMIILKGL